MKTRLLFLLLFGVLASGYSQMPPAYFTGVKAGDSLRQLNQYRASAQAYAVAFAAPNGLAYPIHQYNAACSWSLAGGTDSAFLYLQRLVNRAAYTEYAFAPADPDFIPLQKDARWKPLLAQIKRKKENAEAGLNKPLVAQLEAIYSSDQTLRRKLDIVRKGCGPSSPQITALRSEIKKVDSLNGIQVRAILDKWGWLGADKIGMRGNTTLFAVIQHSNLATQEHYLPLMREAAIRGNAERSNLALLEDRVLLGQGKKQLYGSQLSGDPKTGESYLSPLADPDNVDARRATMGLEPLADYLEFWNLKWDPAAYKKELPKLKEKQWGKGK